ALGNVRADDTVGEATRKLLRPLFLRMQLHESGTYLGHNPQELHDMRVMIRRMRTAFRMAKPYLDLTDLATIRKGLRRTARVLGAVRDMDVFRQKTEAYLAKTGANRDELAPLIQVWDVEYARRRNEMLTYLNSKRYGRFRQTSWAYLDTHLPDRAVAASVRETVPLIVNEQLEALLAQGELIGLPDAPLSAYHQLRINVKHLRYTLRFFRDVLGPEVKSALKMLEALQDTFGDLQDAAVAVDHLRAVIEHGTWETPLQAETRWHAWVGATRPVDATPIGLAEYLRAREAEIVAFVTEAPEIWNRFHEAETPRIVREALAALQP
ncbi:MAG: CHAD domain-containing protein, partial [Anaerolineae bacterium]|nr:CHAD domain-containing protein [Anaerolineae bacterium]